MKMGQYARKADDEGECGSRVDFASPTPGHTAMPERGPALASEDRELSRVSEQGREMMHGS